MSPIEEQQEASEGAQKGRGASSLSLLYKILWPVIIGVAIIGIVHFYRHYDTITRSSLIMTTTPEVEIGETEALPSQDLPQNEVLDPALGKKAFEVARLTFLINRLHDARSALQTDGAACLRSLRVIRGLLSEDEILHLPEVESLSSVESIYTLVKQFQALTSPEQEGGIGAFFGAQFSQLIRVRKAEEAEVKTLGIVPTSFYDMVEKIQKIGDKTPLQETWLMNAKVTKSLDGGLAYLEDVFEEKVVHLIGEGRQNVS